MRGRHRRKGRLVECCAGAGRQDGRHGRHSIASSKPALVRRSPPASPLLKVRRASSIRLRPLAWSKLCVARVTRRSLVHAAAASNLGQMLNRLCLKDGVGLVNIVRSAEQANLLRGMERSLVAEQAMKGWLAPPSSGTALKRTAEWASAIFTSIRSAALLVVGPQLPQAGTASSTLVSRPTRRSSASSSAMVASLGAAAGQLIPRSYVAISVNSNSSSWAFSVIRQYSKSVNGHA